MKQMAVLFAAVVVANSAAWATVYGPGPGGAIADATTTNTAPGVPLNSIITVAGAQPTVASVNSVTITFGTPAHGWAGDIVATLTGPGGDAMHVMSRVRGTGTVLKGDSSDLLGPYTFVQSGGSDFDTVARSVLSLTLVPSGTYNCFTTPAGTPAPPADPDTYSVFAGDEANGAWTLTIQDFSVGSVGSLASWSLDITSAPEPTSLALVALGGLAMVRRRR